MKHKTNSFSSLRQETTDSELKNDKELRNTNKKLKRKGQKYEHNPSDDLLKEMNILETLISEYENSRRPQKQKTSKKDKKKKSSSSSDDGDFLEKEFQKNKEFNHKRYKQQKEDEEKEKKEKQERQKENKYRKYQNYHYEPLQTISNILKNHDMDIHNVPEDITPLLNNYDHKLYKKLCLKYHPDKYEGDSYSKFLNCLKDFYQS